MKTVACLIALLTLFTSNVGLAKGNLSRNRRCQVILCVPNIVPVQESSGAEELTVRVAKLEAEVLQLRSELSELRELMRSSTSNALTPKLALKGTEEYEVNGKSFTRYQLIIENHAAYPNEMFRPAPDLPPCGQNKNSARTWVEIVSSDGEILYGFCALNSPEDLTRLWFAVAEGSAGPGSIYVVLNDREKGEKHKSNTIAISVQE